MALFFGVLGFFAIAANAVEPGASETPRSDVMQVVDGEVLDSVVVGNRVIVVGNFTRVRNAGGSSITQPYIAAYDANTGRFDSGFRPAVDNFINAIDTDGSSLYIIGQFGQVDGEAHRRIAKINSNGSVNSQFTAALGTTPSTVAVANGKVYIGGGFTTVNNVSRQAFAAVDTTRGRLDSVTDFDFSESTQNFGGLTVRWIDVSPDGNFLFMAHSARRIDGQIRSGIARFDISATSTTLSNWQTLLYDNELDSFTLRMRRLAISPDGSYVVQVTSGGDRPPTGDTAIRFPTSGGANVQADWVSRHFDTVLGVAISDDAVYVGGHFFFQEAPGSSNPFPGDPDTVFDNGVGQGPQVLGDEVVQREQLGALSPTTGKSLDWNPGSDSFIGVQSLTWDDELGLLVGHDGNRLGGRNGIGRHAIFPIASNPGGGGNGGGGTGGSTFACSAAFSGNTATVTFTGDQGTSLQLRRNGSWAATATQNPTTITANPGDTITARLRGPNFNGPTDFTCTTGGGTDGGGNGGGGTGGGNFACSAAFSGNTATVTFTGDQGTSLQLRRNGSWAATATQNPTTITANPGDTIVSRVRGPNFNGPTDFTCTTGGGNGGGGNGGGTGGAITTSITSPRNDGVTNSENVTITGQASAPNGLDRVRVTVQRRDTGQYVSASGSLVDGFAALDVDVDGTSDTWSVNVTLPFAGQYDVTARTFDDDGARNDRVRSSFLVGALSNNPPTLFVNDAFIDLPFVNFSGSVADDLGVDRVAILIQNRNTREYFRPDGTMGAAQRHIARLSNPGGTSTNWSLTVRDLDVAEWEVAIDAFDNTGQRDRSRIFFRIDG